MGQIIWGRSQRRQTSIAKLLRQRSGRRRCAEYGIDRANNFPSFTARRSTASAARNRQSRSGLSLDFSVTRILPLPLRCHCLMTTTRAHPANSPRPASSPTLLDESMEQSQNAPGVKTP